MYRPTPLNPATLPVPNLISLSPLRRGLPVVVLALALGLFALSPATQAVTPAPDGGYPNGNTAEGQDALFRLTDGFDNTAVGFQALFRNTSGFSNTAVGFRALASNTTNAGNTATGAGALERNTTGFTNTANGAGALGNNTSGYQNTAIGLEALAFNTTGINNTATGHLALLSNTHGHDNTAAGLNALSSNTTGNRNTATGALALLVNTEGDADTATGYQALRFNTIGRNNTATGDHALTSNTTGSFNVANGVNALANNTSGSFNVALGNQTGVNLTGSNNILLGHQAGANLTTGENNIDIGAHGTAADGNTIRIGSRGTHGATFIAGISGVAVTGSQVLVNSNGQLGVVTSSARFKEGIKSMDETSEMVLKLKPVMFRYKKELDPEQNAQFGLIAEEVARVNPDLVVRNDNGEIYTVRYEAVNAMLLNEFLKEHRKVEEQGAMIAKQQKQIEALTATVQKVSDQIALSKPAPQLVANP
jgi:trimeric autotransporter adhesin